MRIGWLWALLLAICLMFVTTGVAWAHVVVSPEEVPADDFERLVVSVPTEKDIPTTEVRVEVPEGFTAFGVQPVPGWEQEFEEEGGVIRAITWSGGEIQPREFQEFPIQAKTPAETGEYTWRAFQTYEDGEVVEWIGSPEDPAAEEAGEEPAEEPASVIAVTQLGAQTGEAGAAPPESGDIGATPTVAYVGLGLGALALVVALLALLATRRKAE